jgi:CheY-like chemotaxis protein
MAGFRSWRRLVFCRRILSVVALTAYPDDYNREASRSLGATHFLEKPIALEKIAGVAASAGVPTAITPLAGAAGA